MYRIYVLIDRKKILIMQTRSYSNMQGFLADLRKRGFFCEVIYPPRGAQ